MTEQLLAVEIDGSVVTGLSAEQVADAMRSTGRPVWAVPADRLEESGLLWPRVYAQVHHGTQQGRNRSGCQCGQCARFSGPGLAAARRQVERDDQAALPSGVRRAIAVRAAMTGPRS